ncbi:MAG: DegV family protein, partial [Oscillospiraceae bacterium]
KIRGTEKALAKLVDTIGDFLGGRNNLTLVMSHCQCMERALALKKVILERYKEITDIIIVPTSGLSTMYANYGGIILAF